ncbi:hypothetical protein AB9F29_18605 [Falsihalocynthiibacter sp. S25ZX9]|uniref:hypothetical protein n=1 Tax=Falsihalocynthiibacter sp. S25ZX9 TaxID=3240870 RepID=UPI00350EF58C
MWNSIRRKGIDLARCTVERLMHDTGIEGGRRGKKIKTTLPDKALPCAMDRLNRQFRATVLNKFRVSDFSYVSAWQGFVYVAPRQQDCRSAGIQITANTICAGCYGTSALRTTARC